MAYFGAVAALMPVSIGAVYTQSKIINTSTPLEELKTDLVVTAVLPNGRTTVTSNYTLSGTLAVGTSTVTVSYRNVTSTFNVTVSSYNAEWNFVNAASRTALTDSINGYVLDKDRTYSAIVIDGDSYCYLSSNMHYIKFPDNLIFNFDADYDSLEYVINIKKFYNIGDLTPQGRVFTFSDNWGSSSETRLTFNYVDGEHWKFMDGVHSSDILVAEGKTFFDGAALRVILNKTSSTTVKFMFYKDNTFLEESSEISKADFAPYRNALSLSSWRNPVTMALSGIQVIPHYNQA